MVSDSINNRNNGSSPRDFGKKKRANRSAKLKQCKLDARREQWLSHGSNVKGKGLKEGLGSAGLGLLPVHGNGCEERKILESLEVGRKGRGGGLVVTNVEVEEENRGCSDSSSSSPTGSSVLGGSDCGTSFTGSSSSSSSSGSSRWVGCCSGNVTEEEEEEGGGEDNCLDDWEAVADALAVDDDNLGKGNESAVEGDVLRSPQQRVQDVGLDCNSDEGKKDGVSPRWVTGSSRAWRPDDIFRPQNLPTLSKQLSFTIRDRCYPWGGTSSWAHLNAVNMPSSCPICCEELDFTDTSFLPCLCGFRLCLFCHKRILEEDGRCPGCRKPYEGGLVEAGANVHDGCPALRWSRSCSFNARS